MIKKKLVEINTYNVGSTGRIVNSIMELGKTRGYDSILFVAAERINYKNKRKSQFYIGSVFSRRLHLLFYKLTGLCGELSIVSTYKVIKKIEEFKPSIIHIHNLHSCYINIPMLFNYIKNNNIPLVFTLHDCWLFTGKCPHFLVEKCDKWINGCHACKALKNYPNTFSDSSMRMWSKKKKWFQNFNSDNIIFVTPSNWLANLVKKSFLNNFRVKKINNGIDLEVFKPIVSNFRSRIGADNKILILGVAHSWNERKGLDVFINLSKILNNDCQIVLVGVDRFIKNILPPQIISIDRTSNLTELVKIYSSSDVFLNPTREDTFPTVNIEALACGTPVITFNTGGSPEIIDGSCGIVVNDDVNTIAKIIYEKKEWLLSARSNCRERAKLFDQNTKYQEYLDLFDSLIES